LSALAHARSRTIVLTVSLCHAAAQPSKEDGGAPAIEATKGHPGQSTPKETART
jgi:hypothetical protein